MTDWLILVDHQNDIGQAETPHKVMRTTDYLTNPGLFTGRRPYVLNMARTLGYQSEGYYASLLAEARGHRVSPSIQTMVEMSAKSLYAHALPELNEALADALGKGAEPVASLLIAFSRAEHRGYERFARELSDWFRVPVLELEFDHQDFPSIEKIRIASPHRLKGARRAFFLESLGTYTKGSVSQPKTRPPAKWALAVLIDPKEKHPPSKPQSLRKLADVAEKMGVEVEFLEPNDLTSLAEFDALFIRATTRIDNFTYRFARRAEQEGMPVIDDPMSMIRCTNKVYLKEILTKAGLPVPPTEIIDERSDLAGVFERLGSPVVLKTPDGSFGASMAKAKTLPELRQAASIMFRDTALAIAQAFMPTSFDWRIGVLGGEPLFASQYMMAKGHWQINKHTQDGRMIEGNFITMAIEEAPPLVVETAVKAARLIGDGLYGVDLKETPEGVFVIEINDNPNMDTHIEGQFLKQVMWQKLIEWFAKRLEARMGIKV
jgi:glutathione synthase/RimK-type ligase-like ATP-grasp enzyme